ncbi:MAG: hypothetical protein IPG34_00120 [Rhodocyclaceae bacterium]|nr:hypothetical protein [Rhodocyclaceae bacterium]
MSRSAYRRFVRLALMLALVQPAASALAESAPELGRLFFTAERRAALERQRQFNIMETRALEGATLSLDGVVARSSGKSTIWVNGRPSDDADSTQASVRAQLQRSNPGRATLTPGDENPTQIKVGEVINRGTGERDDRLGGGKVVTPNKR